MMKMERVTPQRDNAGEQERQLVMQHEVSSDLSDLTNRRHPGVDGSEIPLAASCNLFLVQIQAAPT